MLKDGLADKVLDCNMESSWRERRGFVFARRDARRDRQKSKMYDEEERHNYNSNSLAQPPPLLFTLHTSINFAHLHP